ncbi:37 kDa salivary gland allergen Aed a 2-like [Uranotaenia lowii]|uniref:37 kDa salivary gland allergen Aed a 2-like n=1 Tax=Uranotaenia lowii TaxID=190385 RepID=UPI0024796748|nr:37 kDa salivary gland allergen Aed a 2-like [Uranotaenia lowii]
MIWIFVLGSIVLLIIEVTTYTSDSKGEFSTKPRFVFEECLDRAAAKICNKTLRKELVDQWKRKQFPNERNTQCYLRCALIEIGTFDSERKMFTEKLKLHWESNLKTNRELESLNFTDFFEDLESVGTISADSESNCEPVYTKFLDLFSKHKSVVLRLYHSDDSYKKQVYQSMCKIPNIKDESSFMYCDNLYFPKNSKSNCSRTENLKQPKYNSTRFKYITDDFQLDGKNLIADSEVFGANVKLIQEAVRKCNEEVPEKNGVVQKPWYRYKCLRETTNIFCWDLNNNFKASDSNDP